MIQPRVAEGLVQSDPLSRRARARGGSWIISVAPAPLMLLPEQDVSAEAAESFPSLIGPNGLGCSGSVFTGLFVGCCVVSGCDDRAFPSPWPLQKSSSEWQLRSLFPFAADAKQCGAWTCSGVWSWSEACGRTLVASSWAAAMVRSQVRRTHNVAAVFAASISQSALTLAATVRYFW